MSKNRYVVYIHQAPTGRWYATGDDVDFLDERGPGYESPREAAKAAAEAGYTHACGGWGGKRGRKLPEAWRTGPDRPMRAW